MLIEVNRETTCCSSTLILNRYRYRHSLDRPRNGWRGSNTLDKQVRVTTYLCEKGIIASCITSLDRRCCREVRGTGIPCYICITTTIHGNICTHLATTSSQIGGEL